LALREAGAGTSSSLCRANASASVIAPSSCLPSLAAVAGVRKVASAVMENLVKVDAEPYLYRLTHSKTDQAPHRT